MKQCKCISIYIYIMYAFYSSEYYMH
uniref:Uncharacterized protein n=1 Tax=Rhizophora mucronata TaxID=61149 RepID=A0A2P2P722_RHIMU